MKKKSLAAAIPLIFAAGFAVAADSGAQSSGASEMQSQSTTTGASGQEVPVPSSEVRMSTDESRADEIMQRARDVSGGQQSDSMQSSGETGGDASSSSGASGRASEMQSQSTTTGMKGQEVPVPSSEVRMSTDESRADEIMQRAQGLSSQQQSGSQSSGSSMDGDAGTAGSSSGMGGPMMEEQREMEREREMDQMHKDQSRGTSGSSDAGAGMPGSDSAAPSGESSGYGRMAPPQSEAGRSNMMQQGDPSTGWGRMAPPESGASPSTR